jgi:hypothetical protein
MSVTLSIGLQAEDDLIPEALEQLMSRLLQKGSLLKGALYKKYSAFEPESISASKIMADISQLAATVVHSRDALRADISYTLRSGHDIVISLNVYGKSFDNGWKVKLNGHIQLTLSLNDIARPLLRNLQSNEKGDLVKKSYNAEIVMGDAEELFLWSCGVTDQEGNTSFIKNGAMYLESGWSIVEGCSMLYHNDVEEFASDIARIYAEYQWGIITASLLNREHDILQLSSSEILRMQTFEPIKDQMRKTSQSRLSEDWGKIIFLESIDRSIIEHVSVVPKSYLVHILRDLPLELPMITYHDFNSKGSALTADPLSSLLVAYKYILSRLDKERY